MWFAKSRALRAGLIVALALVLLPALPAERTGATNRVTIDAREIRITLLVDVVGANQDVIDRWAEAISSHWNNGPGGHPFKWCGLDVIIAADFQLVSEDVVPRPGRHTVNAERLRRGKHYIPNVITPEPYSPDILSGTGNWHYYGRRGQHGGDGYDKLIAHEAGHFLGLGDEYIWDPERHDLNGNGKRDPGEPTEPDTDRFPDAWDSIMAWEGGSVLQRHIDEIIGHHDIDEELDCVLEVSYLHEMIWDPAVSPLTVASGQARFDFSLEVREGDDGVLEGTGTALHHEWSVVSEYRGDPPCTYFIDLRDDSFVSDFQVSGTRDDDQVSLSLPEGIGDSVAVVHTNDCGAAGHGESGTMAEAGGTLLYLREIDAELEDGHFEGVFEEDTVFVTIAGETPVTVRHSIEIVEEPRPAEPEIVSSTFP